MRCIFEHHRVVARARWMNVLRVLVVIACFLLSAEKSWAYCTATNSVIPFSNPLIVQRDVPIGGVIASATAVNKVTCDSDGLSPFDAGWLAIPSFSNYDYGPSSISDVRRTPYPGIGIRWTSRRSNSSTVTVFSSASFNNSAFSQSLGINGATVSDTFELIKLSEGIGSQPISGWAFIYDYRSASGGVALTSLLNMALMNTATKIVACSVMSSNVQVMMGSVEKRQFSGMGSTSATQPFSIPLNCDAGTRVNVTIDATPDSSTMTGVMALDSAGSAGVANGVGIRILQGGTPVTLGTPVAVGTTTHNSAYFVSMQAQYYQSGPVIAPGTANGTATFTMTYD